MLLHGKHLAGAFQLSGRIDTQRRRVDDRHIDSHPRLERPQLLQVFALFQGRRRKADKTREALTAVSIDSDMVVERTGTAWRRCACKVEGAQTASSDWRAHHFHDIEVEALLWPRDFRC